MTHQVGFEFGLTLHGKDGCLVTLHLCHPVNGTSWRRAEQFEPVRYLWYVVLMHLVYRRRLFSIENALAERRQVDLSDADFPAFRILFDPLAERTGDDLVTETDAKDLCRRALLLDVGRVFDELVDPRL